MGDRLTLEQRRVVASLMEVYGSPTVVCQKFAEQLAGRDLPSHLTIYRVYAKFVKTGSVADNYRANAGRPRTGRKRVYSRKIPYINDLKDRIRTVVSSIPREMCVWALNGTVACWLLCVKHDGEQVETIL